MLSAYQWIILTLLACDLMLSVVMILKIRRQEKFQTSEAHGNLELINQSLNRLSEIAEKLESKYQSAREPYRQIQEIAGSGSAAVNGGGASKELRALSLIRKGENPRFISKKLGISRSEMDLLVAQEKLGNGKLAERMGVSQ